MTPPRRRQEQIALAALSAIGFTSFATAARNVIAAVHDPVDSFTEKAKLQKVAIDLRSLMHERGCDKISHNLILFQRRMPSL